MRPLERRRALVALVDRQGDVSLAEACRVFSISSATARRDFDLVASQGLVAKTWGGLRRNLAPTAFPMGETIPIRVRDARAVEAKERIARRACDLVEDGDVVVIDGGSTTLRMAPHLADRPIHILTNSIAMAHALDQLRTEAAGAQVLLTGGYLIPGSGILAGPEVIESLSRFHARWAFLSVSGFDTDGIWNTNQLVADSERAMIRASQESVVLADATKAGRRDMVRVSEWADVAVLVTNETAPGIPVRQVLATSPDLV